MSLYQFQDIIGMTKMNIFLMMLWRRLFLWI